MDYKKIENNGYNIFIIPNKLFHNIEISICFTEKVNKVKITERNFLVNLLTYSTKKYSTTTMLLKKCQDLYSIYPKFSVNRYGNLLRTKFSISVLDSLYIDKNNIIDNIELLKEIVLNPCVVDKKFNSNYFELVRKELIAETKSIEEDSRLYANIKALECSGKDENYTLTGFSDLDILNKITEESIFDSYREMIENSKIDIIVAGNITNEQEIIREIKNIFIINNKCFKVGDAIIHHSKINHELQIIKESKPISQSKISIIGKIYDLQEMEYKCVFSIFNCLFGTMGSNLLMKYVREKNNLCYYIGSYYNKLDNIIVINSGINKNNFDKTLNLIDTVLKYVEMGKFSKKELENAKIEYITELEKLKDSNNSITEYIYGKEIFNTDSLDTKISLAKKVTKEDIMKIAKKVHLEICYFLEGEL